jgi:LPS-assembly protein
MPFRYKNINLILPLILLTVFLTLVSSKNAARPLNFSIPLTYDTIPTPKTDTIPKRIDTTAKVSEVKTFDVKSSKDSLDAPVDYNATDSMVIMVPEQKIILYSKTGVKYQDFDVTAEKIVFDQSNNMLTAYAKTDSTGSITERGKFTQGIGDNASKNQFDTLQFNMKTQRGLVKNTFTKMDEMFANIQIAKKKDSVTTFGKNAVITTCNYDDPHFGFATKKLKYINKKLIVTGPVQPVFEGIKLPIGLPFGIFPQRQGRHSGFLPPQFAVNDQLGVGLEGLGWYHVFNDYIDVTVRSNLYSYGSWNLYLTPVYRKRYRYNGGLNFSIIKNRQNFPGDPDFNKQLAFQIGWNHAVDPKVRPGTTFNASVNAGSSKFNSLIPNNVTRNFNNSLNSSISYSKTFRDKASLTAAANHNQNAVSGDFNVTLPSLTFIYNTVYPFAKENGTGNKWYEKLGIGLSSDVSSTTRFNDTISNTPQPVGAPKQGITDQVLRNWQWGVRHSIPIVLSLPSLGPFQIAPSVSYAENWYPNKSRLQYNTLTKKLDTTINKGFYTARQMSFGLSFNTALFGTATFKNSSVKAIRNVMRPTVGFSYLPNMNKNNYYTTTVDTTNRMQKFSVFALTGIGGFTSERSASLTFGIDNNLEMKVRNKKDTTQGATKKIKLIDGYGINGSYDFMADSLKLSILSLNVRGNLFDKINVTINGSLDPYEKNENGISIDKYVWQNGKFKLGTLSNMSVSASTSFQGKEKKPKDKEGEDDDHNEPVQNTLTLDEQQAQLNYIRNNPGEFVDFNIPWKIDLSLSYNRSRTPAIRGADGVYRSTTTNTASLSLNGDVSITPKWKLGYNGIVNISNKQFEYFTMFLSREMHCWQLNINVTPIGPQRSFNITINPKSGILRDLKINRSRYFSN